MRQLPPCAMCFRSTATYFPPSLSRVTVIVRDMNASSTPGSKLWAPSGDVKARSASALSGPERNLFIDLLLCPGDQERLNRLSVRLVQSHTSVSVGRKPDSENTYTPQATVCCTCVRAIWRRSAWLTSGYFPNL